MNPLKDIVTNVNCGQGLARLTTFERPRNSRRRIPPCVRYWITWRSRSQVMVSDHRTSSLNGWFISPHTCGNLRIEGWTRVANRKPLATVGGIAGSARRSGNGCRALPKLRFLDVGAAPAITVALLALAKAVALRSVQKRAPSLVGRGGWASNRVVRTITNRQTDRNSRSSPARSLRRRRECRRRESGQAMKRENKRSAQSRECFGAGALGPWRK